MPGEGARGRPGQFVKGGAEKVAHPSELLRADALDKQRVAK